MCLLARPAEAESILLQVQYVGKGADSGGDRVRGSLAWEPCCHGSGKLVPMKEAAHLKIIVRSRSAMISPSRPPGYGSACKAYISRDNGGQHAAGSYPLDAEAV